MQIPLPLAVIILLIVSIIFARIYTDIASAIGEKIRMFFIGLWKKLKGYVND